MSLFAVVRRHGPDWDRSRPLREQVGWAATMLAPARVEPWEILLGGL